MLRAEPLLEAAQLDAAQARRRGEVRINRWALGGTAGSDLPQGSRCKE